jgi:hypothetical protein
LVYLIEYREEGKTDDDERGRGEGEGGGKGGGGGGRGGKQVYTGINTQKEPNYIFICIRIHQLGNYLFYKTYRLHNSIYICFGSKEQIEKLHYSFYICLLYML